MKLEPTHHTEYPSSPPVPKVGMIYRIAKDCKSKEWIKLYSPSNQPKSLLSPPQEIIGQLVDVYA